MRADRSTGRYVPSKSVVQKTALTAIVDQAYNSNERPLLRGPRPSRRLGRAYHFCRIAFRRRPPSARI